MCVFKTPKVDGEQLALEKAAQQRAEEDAQAEYEAEQAQIREDKQAALNARAGGDLSTDTTGRASRAFRAAGSDRSFFGG